LSPSFFIIGVYWWQKSITFAAENLFSVEFVEYT
jgi:hypothetical protein